MIISPLRTFNDVSALNAPLMFQHVYVLFFCSHIHKCYNFWLPHNFVKFGNQENLGAIVLLKLQRSFLAFRVILYISRLIRP